MPRQDCSKTIEYVNIFYATVIFLAVVPQMALAGCAAGSNGYVTSGAECGGRGVIQYLKQILLEVPYSETHSFLSLLVVRQSRRKSVL